jgi:nucleoside-diphosphate-sugar epimerase
MGKILVTGAGGFIGSHMVEYLQEKGHTVRGVDIKLPEFSRTKAEQFELLDLRKPESCENAMRNIDQVYAFAADMGGIGYITQVKADVMRNNVLINANTLSACVKNNVDRLFFSSSACIYPKQLQLDSTVVASLKEEEALPAYPGTAYGWEKLYTEMMCKAYVEDYGLTVRIARYHNIYGPEGTYKGGREKAPAALCRKIAETEDGGKITIWGDGKQIRSFLYVDDCLEATVLLMESDCQEPLNIGSDSPISIDELADLIIGISGKKFVKKHDLSKPVGVRSRNADLSLLKKNLWWEPKISYQEGLEKTYKWIEEQVRKSS